MQENPYQPYVGSRAFAHKGGVHVDAVMKIPRAYEHIDPELVGNKRQLIVSELAGRAAVINQALSLGLKLEKQNEAVRRTLEEVKELEAQGYLLDDSNATVNLILVRNLGINPKILDVVYWGVTVSREESGTVESIGDVIVKAGPEVRHGRGKGVGPVHALDNALRAAIGKILPEILRVSLVNYKVSVVDSVEGTASKVRVLIEFTDGDEKWSTTALSRNILEASINALIDGYNYKLITDRLRKEGATLKSS
jgi:2-isopropylmalate synthase